ncbi:asparagine synthase-related protein [Celerinatantimonas sp. YJH-8]|uniref:asparagine synthase-related protein n=1 Tax=Celerinatantimonas sp. YJH-8 TaxID=3228714 RepID=UPI0038C9467B
MSTVHACFQFQHPVNPVQIQQMLSASDYWQPDACSYLFSKDSHCSLAKANLFNTRYSYHDFVYHDPQTGSMITANARLDNRNELYRQLALPPEQGEWLSDGQLILQAYLHWGRDCPKYLLGDFAFVIWDESTQSLFAARDPFGVKLLLLSQRDDGVMLSNEPNAFFSSGWLPEKQLEESWLIETLGHFHLPVSKPAYRGMQLLPAAHYLVIDRRGCRQVRYWSLQESSQWAGIDDESLLAEFRSRFQQAVALRLESDYPLGSELSEGLDSNGITGMAATLKPEQDIYTFSYQCVALTEKTQAVWEPTYQPILAMLAMYPNLKPVWVDDEQFTSHESSRLAKVMAGSFCFQSGGLWHSKLAQRQGCRVLLSGWGGDHCVSSYGDFYESELFRARQWRRLQQLLKDKRRRGRGGVPWKGWLNVWLKHFSPALYAWYKLKRPGLERALWQRADHCLVNADYTKQYQGRRHLLHFLKHYQRFYDVKGHHRRELFDIGVEQRLIDSELSARMYRVEMRFPMLDIPLVEMAYNLPSELKIHQGIERYHYRRMIEGLTTQRNQWALKSDVHPPQRENDYEQNLAALKEAFQTMPLLRQYCRLELLEPASIDDQWMVRNIYQKLPYFRYWATQRDLKIVTSD